MAILNIGSTNRDRIMPKDYGPARLRPLRQNRRDLLWRDKGAGTDAVRLGANAGRADPSGLVPC